MSRDLSILAITFACYFAAVLAIGWYAYRRTATIADFVLGGRGLGSGAAALSAGASDMSGWLLLGLPGLAYAAGLESPSPRGTAAPSARPPRSHWPHGGSVISASRTSWPDSRGFGRRPLCPGRGGSRSPGSPSP